MGHKILVTATVLAALSPVTAHAATIQVGSGCSIAEAIQAAETDSAVGACVAGDQADEIVVPAGTDEVWTSAPTTISTELTLRTDSGRATIRRDTSAAYFTLLTLTPSGVVTLLDVNLRDGVSDDSAGCVLVPQGATFTARRAIFDGCGLSPTNTAGLPAGAIRNGGTMLLDSCLIVNTTTNTTEAALRTNGGTTTLVNTTVTASTASGVRHWNGTLDLLHSTIVGNGAFDVRIRGGRVANARNSVVENVEGSWGATEGSLLSTAPLLGPLQDNGGPTGTLAPLQGSPTLDAADDTFCEALDQRGQARPSGDHCDIGAVEHQVVCDNGFLHPSEDCDGAQLQPQFQTCPQGYEGTPVCDSTCAVTGCTAIVDAGVGGMGGASGSGPGGSGGAGGSAGSSGSGGAPQDAGTAGSPTYEGDGSTADAGVRSKKPDDGGCNCRVPGVPQSTPRPIVPLLCAAGVLILGRWSRRRRRSQQAR